MARAGDIPHKHLWGEYRRVGSVVSYNCGYGTCTLLKRQRDDQVTYSTDGGNTWHETLEGEDDEP